jgi:hypothetical protein
MDDSYHIRVFLQRSHYSTVSRESFKNTSKQVLVDQMNNTLMNTGAQEVPRELLFQYGVHGKDKRNFYSSTYNQSWGANMKMPVFGRSAKIELEYSKPHPQYLHDHDKTIQRVTAIARINRHYSAPYQTESKQSYCAQNSALGKFFNILFVCVKQTCYIHLDVCAIFLELTLIAWYILIAVQKPIFCCGIIVQIF